MPANGTRGGILIAWKGCVCRALSTRIDTFSASVQFQLVDGASWWFTGVYGPQSDEGKVQFLSELRDIRRACNGPWAIGGDFNMIYRAEDKNNTNIDRPMMGRFRRFLNELELKEIALLCRKYDILEEYQPAVLILEISD